MVNRLEVQNGMAPHENSDKRERNSQIRLVEFEKREIAESEEGLQLVRKEWRPSVGWESEGISELE
jgi:hypothetical protein